jgi:hypothetical protein
MHACLNIWIFELKKINSPSEMYAWVDWRGGEKVEFVFVITSKIKLVANICSLMVCPKKKYIVNKILENLESRQLGFWFHRIL